MVLLDAEVLRRDATVTAAVLARIFRGKTAVVHAHFKVISKRRGSKRPNFVNVGIDAVDIWWHHEFHIETILMIKLLWWFCLVYIGIILRVISNLRWLLQLAICLLLILLV